MVSKLIFDCLTGKTIEVNRHNISDLGISVTELYRNRKPKQSGVLYFNSRYVFQSDVDKLFTLIDYDTNTEYVCCTNETLFLHFGKEYNDNEAKYIYELKSKRQKFASIFGRIFYLKGTHADLNKKCTAKKSNSERADVLKLKFKKNALIRNRINHRIRMALLSNGLGKDKKTEKYIGCTMPQLFQYVENKFTKNMNWDNSHDWHIDHIIPCSSFDLTNEVDLAKCFHYTNLQPIWRTSKVANKYGESKLYIGNIDKSDKDIPIDYSLKKHIEKFLETSHFNMSEKHTFDLSVHLIRKGARLEISN